MSSQEDEVAELEQVAERIASVVERVGGQGKAAAIARASRASIQKWRSANARPPLIEVSRLARAAGATLEWIATGREIEAKQGSVVVLPRYDVTFDGELTRSDGADWSDIAFFRPALDQRGAHIESTIALIADGREMEPSIREGAVLAVDRSRSDLLTPGVYVFIRGNRMMLLRCEPRLDGGVVLTRDSDPADRQVVPVDKISSLNVVGKVVLAVSEP